MPKLDIKLSDLKRYNKFWVALGAAVAQLILVCAPLEGELAFVVTRAEWYTVVVAAAGAIGVYQIANKK